jgi:hypothetical protein
MYLSDAPKDAFRRCPSAATLRTGSSAFTVRAAFRVALRFLERDAPIEGSWKGVSPMFRSLMTTVLMLGTLSAAAVAQTGGSSSNKPLEVRVTKLHCTNSSESSDEPYLVVFGASFRGGVSAGRVWTTSPFSDVNDGDNRDFNLQIWSLDGANPAPIESANDYIFLVALMEEDDGDNRKAIEKRVTAATVSNLTSYTESGMSREAMVKILKSDMDDAIETARHHDDNEDDRIGGTYELLFTSDQVDAARSGNPVEVTRDFAGSSGRYTVTFRLQ